MQRLCLKHFCSSPLRNENIPIHDMHNYKALRIALLMQGYVSYSSYRETSQDKLFGAMKHCIVAYRGIAKCQIALRRVIGLL